MAEDAVRPSPAYWRGRAEFLAAAAAKRPELAGAFIARARFYERIASGLERRAVDPDFLVKNGE